MSRIALDHHPEPARKGTIVAAVSGSISSTAIFLNKRASREMDVLKDVDVSRSTFNGAESARQIERLAAWRSPPDEAGSQGCGFVARLPWHHQMTNGVNTRD